MLSGAFLHLEAASADIPLPLAGTGLGRNGLLMTQRPVSNPPVLVVSKSGPYLASHFLVVLRIVYLVVYVFKS